MAAIAADGMSMRLPVPVLAAIIFVLVLLALLLGGQRVRSEPNLDVPHVDECIKRLASSGITVERAAPSALAVAGQCTIADPVMLIAAPDAALPERRIRFPDRPLLSCAMAERFARFSSDIAAPLALGVYGRELVSLRTGPGYECRPRNRQSGAKISSHGQGDAVDIVGVELYGGRKVNIGKPDSPESVRFIAAIRAAACGAFSTVLGPGADAAHANHLHMDIEKRGHDGRSKLCR